MNDHHSAACYCQMVPLAARPVWLWAIYRRTIWSFNSWVFWRCGLSGDAVCFYSHFQIVSSMVLIKIPNAALMYFLQFPYIVNVFLIVQALSLSAMECLRSVFLYGLKFRTAKVLMFDLDWCKVYGHLFPSFRIMPTWGHVEKGKYLQFEVKLAFWSSTAPLLLSVKQQGSCQSRCQPLTVSLPLSVIVST